jgi:ABC-type antimicrobial peptide transport system permease subunit
VIERGLSNVAAIGWLLSGFAALGLLLAAIGIYGVISNSVAQRTAEIGIRMALGAQVRDVLRLVMSQGMRLAVFGTIVGLAGAWWVTRLLHSFMPRLPSLDSFGLFAITFLLLTVVAFACWIPARRAARVDPMEALRNE